MTSPVDRHLGDIERDRFAGAVLKGGLPETPVRDTLPEASEDFAYRSVALRDTPDSVYTCLRNQDGDWTWEESAGLFNNFFNGSTLEPFDALVTSDGATITMSLEKTGTGDLTMNFSDGHSTFDCTPAATIALTAGSDTSPQANYIYILQSTKALTKSTSAWPATEHIRIGFFFVPSAAYVQSSGVYINQNWNDEIDTNDHEGHMAHLTERERLSGALYFSGIDGNGSDNYLTPTASNVELISTAGVIYQVHSHVFPAFDTSSGDETLVKNWSGDAYHNITNLFDIVADSGGNAIGNNKFFNLVVWGVANKTGENHELIINLPSGFYNTQATAEADASGHDDFTIPREFGLDSSTGFLIARITIQMNTTWVVASTVDLRGSTPQIAKGGAASIVTEFADNAFEIFDEGDITKVLAFSVGAITTATTRTVTLQDASGTMAYSADITADIATHAALGDEHHAQAHSLASHSSEAHSELSGVGIDDHHNHDSSAQAVTISSGSVTMTGVKPNEVLQVFVESSPTTDDLDTIAGAGHIGQIVVVNAADSAATVTCKDGTGNMHLAGDMSLDHNDDTLTLVWGGSFFREMARSNNA